MATKNCTRCFAEKPIEEFPNKKSRCRLCINEKQREFRAASHNKYTRKYEKTKSGFLMRAYRNMQSRVNGVQWRKAHLYFGKSLLDRDEFYKWAMSEKELDRLFDAWKDLGCDRKYAPSIDRIDSRLGYEIGNIRWITHSENSRRGSLSRHKACQIGST